MRVFLALACLGLCAGPLAVSAQAGFTTTNDVSLNAKIDLDQQNLETAVGVTPPDYAGARTAYTNKQDSSVKSLKELSSTLKDANPDMAFALKMKSDSTVSVVQAYVQYWATAPLGAGAVSCQTSSTGISSGCPNYADVMISAYLGATGHASGAPDAARGQVIKKGTAYHAVWLEVVNQLSHAVHKAGMMGSDMMHDGMPPSKAVGMHVDLAWAYYTGSKASVLPEALARKRAAEFGTCSLIPNDVLKAFKDAQTAASTSGFDKAKLTTAVTNIIPLITVPLIQACIRYLTLNDGKVNDMSDASRAEMFAFCSAILPQMNSADAAVLRNMIDWKNKPTVDTAAGLKAISNSYARMGVSSSTVGKFDPKVGETGSNPCSSGSSLTASLAMALLGAALALYAAM